MTTLFWGAGATLQFIVIKWAEAAFGAGPLKSLHAAGVVAVESPSARHSRPASSPLRRSVKVILLGIAMGLIVLVMNFVRDLELAVPCSSLVGGLSGFFVVPMNALLQHRGHILMGASHFDRSPEFQREPLDSRDDRALLRHDQGGPVDLRSHHPFGLFVSGMMFLVKRLHEANQRRYDDVAHLDDSGH